MRFVMFVFMTCMGIASLDAQHLKQPQWCENIENLSSTDLYDCIFLSSATITAAYAYDVWTRDPRKLEDSVRKHRRLAAAGSVTTLLGLARITHYFASTGGFDKH